MIIVKFDVKKFNERINFDLRQEQVKDVLIKARLCDCKLSDDNVLVQPKSDSSKFSKKKVFEHKIGCWKCKQFEYMKNNACLSKNSRLNADGVFIVKENNYFL